MKHTVATKWHHKFILKSHYHYWRAVREGLIVAELYLLHHMFGRHATKWVVSFFRSILCNLRFISVWEHNNNEKKTRNICSRITSLSYWFNASYLCEIECCRFCELFKLSLVSLFYAFFYSSFSPLVCLLKYNLRSLCAVRCHSAIYYCFTMEHKRWEKAETVVSLWYSST